MDDKLKQSIIKKYQNCLRHIAIAEQSKVYCVYKKSTRKQKYLKRRGERAKLRLVQFESIPFLTKG